MIHNITVVAYNANKDYLAQILLVSNTRPDMFFHIGAAMGARWPPLPSESLILEVLQVPNRVRTRWWQERKRFGSDTNQWSLLPGML